MKALEDRIEFLKKHIEENQITIMILGLGSVGTYLLDYLISRQDERIKLIVVGRTAEKMESSVNIIRVGALIRGRNRSEICMEAGVDFNDTEQVAECIRKYQPDFIINSSRVYSGLKYGSISWKYLRAYGVWSPLAIKYIRNIMEAVQIVNSDAIVINTSYSDAVIPWLKSAGRAYPDFGSGNLNHLAPRIKFAVADMLQIDDFWNVEVMLATSHFHDVVISKEGHTEGMEQLIKIYYKEKTIDFDQKVLFQRCKIPMPVDAKRNIMNASSNYYIIDSILNAIENKCGVTFLSPGAFGEVGGYPVKIDASRKQVEIDIDESAFTIEQMRKANRESISFDGIEDIVDGKLIYTDQLLDKINTSLGVRLNKEIAFSEIDDVADEIVRKIIIPFSET